MTPRSPFPADRPHPHQYMPSSISSPFVLTSRKVRWNHALFYRYHLSCQSLALLDSTAADNAQTSLPPPASYGWGAVQLDVTSLTQPPCLFFCRFFASLMEPEPESVVDLTSGTYRYQRISPPDVLRPETVITRPFNIEPETIQTAFDSLACGEDEGRLPIFPTNPETFPLRSRIAALKPA